MNRKTTQHLIPNKKENDAQDTYRIYPSFNMNKEKILEIIFDFPTRRFHLRELARLLKISPPAISKALKELEKELTPYIKTQFERQLKFLRRDVAFVVGKGKNLKFLEKLNKSEGYFEKLEVLPHPRWVMQYRLKQKQEFIAEFVQKISSWVK